MERLQIDLYRWDNLEGHNASPIILGKVEMCNAKFLIDTGAGLSYLDKSFVKNHPLLSHFVEDTKISCVTNMVGGSTISEEVLITKNLIFKAGKYSCQFNLIDIALATENKEVIYNGILGLDFLLNYGGKLNFTNNTLTI